MKESKLKNCVHLELDVLLYTPLLKLKRLKYFSDKMISYPMDNSVRGIASFMFIPDYNSINDFCKFIMNQKIPLNDMELLGLYSNRNILPINPSDKRGIFDCAGIGQLLGGTHQNPNVPFINETCIIDYSKYKIERKSDGYYIDDVKIHCLHIHSKLLNQFII